MGVELAELDLEPRLELVRDPPPGWQDLAEINEAAYYASQGGSYFGPALARLAERPYIARLDGRPASCLAIADADGDAYVQLVATRPEAQRRGLAGELLKFALREARDRGCTTTTLEGSPAGAPLYARMGYHDLGVLQMWERRVRNDSA
jgi:GNAT superfamily N-acetyltransferase